MSEMQKQVKFLGMLLAACQFLTEMHCFQDSLSFLFVQQSVKATSKIPGELCCDTMTSTLVKENLTVLGAKLILQVYKASTLRVNSRRKGGDKLQER